MKNIKNKDYSSILQLSPEELKQTQKKKGWALYFVGIIVYRILIVFGNQPKNYHNICPYFEIGDNWGGLEFGWFFICGKKSSDNLKNHEVGHGIQNANIGGITMSFLCLCSAIRYWKRNIFGANTAYDSWWFEGQATELGSKYVSMHKN